MSKLTPSRLTANADEIAAPWRAFETLRQRSRHSNAGHDAVSAASRALPALFTLTVDSLPGGQCGGSRYVGRVALFALSPESRAGAFRARGALEGCAIPDFRPPRHPHQGAPEPLDARGFRGSRGGLSTTERLTLRPEVGQIKAPVRATTLSPGRTLLAERIWTIDGAPSIMQRTNPRCRPDLFTSEGPSLRRARPDWS